MNDHPLAELYRGPFEDTPPLLFDLFDQDEKKEPPSQEAGSVRAAGTMDS